MEYYPNGRRKHCNSAQGENHQHSEEAIAFDQMENFLQDLDLYIEEMSLLFLEVLKERLAYFSGHDLFMGWYMILYHIPF